MKKEESNVSEFVVCFSTVDGVIAKLHAFRRGESSVRNDNHVQDIITHFVKDNPILTRAPQDGERALFEVRLFSCGFGRRNNSYKIDYRRIEPCPQCVAEAGMDIYYQLKSLLRRCRKDKS